MPIKRKETIEENSIDQFRIGLVQRIDISVHSSVSKTDRRIDTFDTIHIDTFHMIRIDIHKMCMVLFIRFVSIYLIRCFPCILLVHSAVLI